MENFKSWIVVILTFVFIACYLDGLFGSQVTPNKDIVNALGPIVAVIIGYYFGRMPSEKVENSLKEQANQKTTEARQAQEERATALEQKSKLSQKVQDAISALSSGAPAAPVNELALTLSVKGADSPDDAVRTASVSALKILQS